MAFDKSTRNLLAKTVAACRRRLIEDVTDQLRGVFGLHPDGTALPLDKLTHLSPDQNSAALHLRDLLDHCTAGAAGKESDRRKAAYEQMVLEISFTVLNRLAALRLCEERGLVIECVRKGTTSAGFQMFERISGGALGGRYDTYRVFLECLFDELALDLGVLFDRMTPQSAVFPTERCMEDVLAELNKPELTHLWTEDETIGWIYQYFNPPEERKAMREASQAPRNSRELAVRNQFFTPRYVVEFLTDNTLGRIWYEMRKGETALKEECRYLVRRPNEVFLYPAARFHMEPRTEIAAAYEGDFTRLPNPEQVTWDDLQHLALAIDGYALAPALGLGDCGELANRRLQESEQTGRWTGDAAELWCCLFFEQRRWRHFGEAPDGQAFEEIKALFETLRERLNVNTGGLSQQELLKLPVFIPHRPKKDPRDLRMLDPACGSGHFPLYAFDLLERIYEEAWADPDSPKSEITGRTLREDFETLDELRLAAPKLIIEHNLHGIDIDPRAVQIAALALWLRAQKSWKKLGIKAADRPHIFKSNIVTAEPMPGEENMRREFIAGIKPRVLGQLVDVVFEKMKLAGEAGSLLKIEEEIKDAIAEARKQWLVGPRMEQGFLFPDIKVRQVKQLQMQFDVRSVTEEGFWEQAEDHILDALKDYAERAENGHATRRRLFAEDAARGFAFIDLSRKRYDVVLMNPPFGESVAITSSYFSRTIPNWCKNLASAFVGRLVTLITDKAKVGTVTDRTILIKSSYEDFRINYALGAFTIGPLGDLGWGVLDANVEVSAVVFSNTVSLADETLFLDCREEHAKESFLRELINSNDAQPKKRWLRPQSFLRLPNAAIAHAMPGFVIRWFNTYPSLKAGSAKTLQGHAIKMDWYGRLRWEVRSELIGSTSTWSNMYNGGSFSRFYLPLVEVVRWNHDGTFLKFHPSTRWSNAESQQKPGIGYGKRGNILDAHLVPAGLVFTVEGLFVLPESIDLAWYYLGILNSPLCSVILNYYCGQHKHAGYVDLLPIPVPDSSDETKKHVSEIACEGWKLQRDLDTANEASPFFIASWLCVFRGMDSQFNNIQEHVASKASSITTLVRELEDCTEAIYGLSESERLVIADDLQKAFNDVGRNDEEEDDNGGSRIDVSIIALDSLSYVLGLVLGRWDLRIALDPSLAPKLPNPFDPLPACPPGMLVGPDGMPAEPNRIVSEEWLQARLDANTLPPEGSVKNPTVPDVSYPLHVSWNGILVDDPGFNGAQPHRDDIVRRVREVLDLLWKDKAHEIEQEACDILGVSDLRDYFRKPAGFFQNHLKRYSKSRRKAPIYWPLSTASGSYTLWVYYHRLTDQTLYTAVNKYVEPKITETERGIARIQDDMKVTSSREATRLTDRLNEARAFLGELREFREELLRIAALPFKPDLNDGVIINAAPFHKLFRLRSWADDTKGCWKKLEDGDYDWAHLAYTIWPNRVRGVCRTDRSIAIAHGLENLCDVEAQGAKKKGGARRPKTVES